jgi:serine/threonine-protein kinase
MYTIGEKIAQGGMATVSLGRLDGPDGFARCVAIKRLHPHLACQEKMVRRFVLEARLAVRVRHPNVVPILDLVTNDGAPYIVMEYVLGASLETVLRGARARGERVPVAIACAIAAGVLRGLHAAHEAKDDMGQPLGIVHRDLSPRNVLVGVDGVPRIVDFGIAKTSSSNDMTREGEIKGTLAYMAPEQVENQRVTSAADIFVASALLWEMLTGEALFAHENAAGTVARVLCAPIDAPSTFAAEVGPELDAIVLRGLSREPEARFASAGEMARALDHAGVSVACAAEIAEWVAPLVTACAASPAPRDDAETTPTVLPTHPPPKIRLPHPHRNPAVAGFIAVLVMLTTIFVVRRGPVDASASAPVVLVRMTHPPPSAPVSAPLASAVPLPPSATPPATPARAKGAPRAAPAQRGPVRVPRTACETPYTVDANDVRRYKLECL